MIRACCVVLAVGAVWVGLLSGCGRKQQELVPGAAKMSDEQKLAKVREYCNEWVSALEAIYQKRNIESFPAVFQRAEEDSKGCEIDLRQLTSMLRSRLQESPIIILTTIGGGQIKARMRYLTGKSGNPADAECVFTLSAGIGAGGAAYTKEYRPDPRVFAVFLKKGN